MRVVITLPIASPAPEEKDADDGDRQGEEYCAHDLLTQWCLAAIAAVRRHVSVVGKFKAPAPAPAGAGQG